MLHLFAELRQRFYGPGHDLRYHEKPSHDLSFIHF